MDILAARKKAAERARTAKTREAVPEEPAARATKLEPEEQQAPEPSSTEIAQAEKEWPAAMPGPEGGFPPLPDVSFVPDEPVSAQKRTQAGADQTDAPPPGEHKEETAVEPVSDPGAAPAPEQDLEMLSFLLGSEEYVVAVDRVREVLTPREITPVPHAADHLLGVCSLRGIVMPIIDLNLRLGLAASARDEKSRIIVVSLGKDDQVGLFVDRVRGVVRFAPSAVQPTPETVEQGARAEFLKGIARKNDRLYILLDVEKAAGA